MEKRRNKFLTIILASAASLIALLVILGSFKPADEVAPVKPHFALEAKIDEPAKDTSIDFLAPNGKATLTMVTSGEVNGLVTQTFYILLEEDETKTKIFEKDSVPGSLLSVPENTFSPDNKYIFLTYEEDGKIRYIVLLTNGEDIIKDSQTVEISELFYEKYSDLVITDVTGWGSYNLLVVNTDTLEGKTGPSWWFDLTNFSFIRLSSRFN